MQDAAVQIAPARRGPGGGFPLFPSTLPDRLQPSVTTGRDTLRFHERFFVVVIDDKVKIRCLGCKRIFREKAKRVRDGAQVNCPDCCKLITISKETDDSVMRRALKTARDIRAAQEAELVKAVYTGAASAPPRDTP